MKSLSVSTFFFPLSFSLSHSISNIKNLKKIGKTQTRNLLECVILYWLIVKTEENELLQVHLIEGILDQVNGTVYVSWAQPRVLGIPQIKSLRDQLDSWVDKVHTTLLSVEAETPDLVAA